MKNKLEDIGFYTLTNNRAMTVDTHSPIMRCEILLTDKCNFKCPYCRGMENKGSLDTYKVINYLQNIDSEKLINIRFSGGEPTLHPNLKDLVEICKYRNVQRIALSTNGSASQKFYSKLIKAGINDFSISLDSGCCSVGEKMTGGIKDSWKTVVENIKYISKSSYTTVGVVFNELNYNQAKETIEFIDSLGVQDIRIIPSSQYNKALLNLTTLPANLIQKYPILSYRINNLKQKRQFRGIRQVDCKKCYLVLDDVAISGNYHYPCIIYLRERGNPIGTVSSKFRKERIEWFKTHDSSKDIICSKNCLDVCCDYNNKVYYYVNKNARNII